MIGASNRAWAVLSGHRDIYRYTIEISRYTPRRYLDIYRYALAAPSLALSILIFQQLQAPPRLLCIEEKSYSNAMLLKHWKVFWLMRKTCKCAMTSIFIRFDIRILNAETRFHWINEYIHCFWLTLTWSFCYDNFVVVVVFNRPCEIF